MYWVLIALHLIISSALVIVILVQTGKGASLGAVFGGGSSSTLFGSQTHTVITKITITLAIIFVVNSLLLSIIGARQGSIIKGTAAPSGAAADIGSVEADEGVSDAQRQTQPAQTQDAAPAAEPAASAEE